jgi:hypothetical protein
MRHLWEAWIAEVQYAGREARARRTKAVGAFEKVTPPAGWLDRHARLVTELDVVAGDAPIADRVRALGQLDALIAELQQDLSESAQASYLAQARHLQGELAYAASDANRRVQTATARSGRKLARMWRPAGVAAEHDALRTLLAEYGSLQQAFHDAITARDDAAAATANAAFQGLRPEIEQAWGRLREATRVKDRWVLPEQPSRSA